MITDKIILKISEIGEYKYFAHFCNNLKFYLMKHWLNKLVHRIAPQTGDLRISHVKGLQDGRTLKKTVGQVLREST